MARPTRPTSASWASIATLLCALLLAAAAAAQPVREPAPGVLLVASERMGDPRFNRAVVLIVEHGRRGSWGLIINKPTDVPVADVVPSLADIGDGPKVHFGGPVQVDHIRLLYRDDAAPEGNDTGLPGVHWSRSPDALAGRLARNPDEVRIYAGYAGWAPGQLSFELTHGGWRMIQGRAANVFRDDPEGLWRRLSDALDGIAI